MRNRNPDYLRYLGALGVLSECSPYVDDDIRESIEAVFTDAAKHHPVRFTHILDRLQIEPDDKAILELETDNA